MWLIPGKTKIKLEVFKGVGVIDILLGFLSVLIIVLVISSNIPHRFIVAGVVLFVAVLLLARVDEEANYQMVVRMLNHLAVVKRFRKLNGKKGKDIAALSAFTDISEGHVYYGSDYMGAVIEIDPVNFRLFSQSRQNASIVNGLGVVLRGLNFNYGANIVKLERPVHYAAYVEKEYSKLEDLRASFELGQLTEDEFKSRSEIVYERIDMLSFMDKSNAVVVPFYYLALFDSDARQLENNISNALTTLQGNEITGHRLNDKELALFLKYSNCSNVDESELDNLSPDEYARWAMPDEVRFKVRTTEVEHVVSHIMRVTDYPSMAGDAWLASVMTLPGTKVVVKCSPMDMDKAVRNIDHSLFELQSQLNETRTQSKVIELSGHIESLSQLLVTLKGENEMLLNTNIYVTAYDVVTSEKLKKIEAESNTVLPRVTNMKRTVRRTYSEHSLKVRGLDFQQFRMYVGSQVSGYDPFVKSARSIPTNSLAACYPWIFASIKDENGVLLGSSDGVPVFMDFFRRDSERVNSNMVIVGKSGSGKSYATKGILANLAADNAKIFILDPENEYSELAENLHGKFINVGNAQYGRLNPFHIMTALDDDEEGTNTVSGSFATHLQFLEEFFRQIMPDCDRDALEYLNMIIERMYLERGINAETDLSRLRPTDYPVFDDLYDSILKEFQKSDNEYIKTMLRTLINYIAKFAAGGRNANIWNGASTITTEENFTVFNFQSLLSNRNAAIANAQMLLVLKYVDNEIIKNRDYNLRNHANRKVVVVIDEAHVFIDTKYPLALDFMFQLAKRIRKYNGMQIVITQNIKDFVGSEEISRKSAAIINASQYSLIFSLAPNDLDDLCTLYEKAGGINDVEQETISTAPRGQAFAVLGPLQRTTFRIDVPELVVDMFSEKHVEGHNFSGEDGKIIWDGFLGDSKEKRMEHMLDRMSEQEEEMTSFAPSLVHFTELSEDEVLSLEEENAKTASSGKSEAQTEPAEPEGRITENLYTSREDAGAENLMPNRVLSPLAGENIELRIQNAVQSEMSEANGKLIQALQTLSFDSIGLLIQQAVQTEFAKREAELTKREAELTKREEELTAIPAEVPAPEKVEETKPEVSSVSFDIKPAIEPVETKAETVALSQEDEEEMEFFRMLNASLTSARKESPIRQMERYDEEVLEVTIEDLVSYVNGL